MALKRTTIVLLFATLLACHQKESSTATTTTATTETTTASTATAATQTTVPPADAEDLAGLAQGAMVVSSPTSYNEAYYMLDEDPRTSWSADTVVNKPVVIALAQQSAIERITFDDAVAEYEGQVPRNVVVE